MCHSVKLRYTHPTLTTDRTTYGGIGRSPAVLVPTSSSISDHETRLNQHLRGRCGRDECGADRGSREETEGDDWTTHLDEVLST